MWKIHNINFSAHKWSGKKSQTACMVDLIQLNAFYNYGLQLSKVEMLFESTFFTMDSLVLYRLFRNLDKLEVWIVSDNSKCRMTLYTTSQWRTLLEGHNNIIRFHFRTQKMSIAHRKFNKSLDKINTSNCIIMLTIIEQGHNTLYDTAHFYNAVNIMYIVWLR